MMRKVLLFLLSFVIVNSAYLRREEDFSYKPLSQEESFFISYKDDVRKDVLNNVNFDVVNQEESK